MVSLLKLIAMKKFVLLITLVFIGFQFFQVYHERQLQGILGKSTEIIKYEVLDSIYSPFFDYMSGNYPDKSRPLNCTGEYVEYYDSLGNKKALIIYFKDGYYNHTSEDNLRLYHTFRK